MSLILCIETATRVCSAALERDGVLLALKESTELNSHSSVLTGFIQQVLTETGHKISDLDAVAISKGPGSFTGLRIGVSTAKGLCFSLDKPLIAIGTLQAMAFEMAREYDGPDPGRTLFCPMIDARRMEVYLALYDQQGREVLPPCAKIILEDTFSSYAKDHLLVFAGDGAEKSRSVLPSSCSYLFPDLTLPSARYMAQLAEEVFRQGNFEDVAYFEPYYLKDFVAGKPKVKGLQ
jgi:tRNA threonylcarbamoyladenosine biosynthesis protein TsaB